MITLTGEQVECICNDWQGNQGPLSLAQVAAKYGLTTNQAYSVLSATDAKNTMTYRKKTGVRIHSYEKNYRKAS